MAKFIIDRVEEGFAVCECEDLTHVLIPVTNFDFELKEGMAVVMNSDGSYSRNESQEEENRRKILEIQRKIRNKEN